MTRKPLLAGGLVAVVLTISDIAPPIRLAPALRLRQTVAVNGACPGVGQVSVGSATSVTYCYTVTNTGSTAARDIVITDARGSVRVGTLHGGESRTVARTLAAVPDAGWVATEPSVATAADEPAMGAAEAADLDGATPEISLTTLATDAAGDRQAAVGESQPGDVVSGATPATATTLQSP
jgi:hypothetical protein